MTDQPAPAPSPRLTWAWWLLWLATVALASVTPWMHWRWQVAAAIEPLRFPWGLLPAQWLFFRYSGEVAGWALAWVLFSGLWAWCKPRAGRFIIASAVVVVLAVTVAGTLLSGRLLIVQIEREARMTPDERLREYMGLPPAKPPSQQEPTKSPDVRVSPH